LVVSNTMRLPSVEIARTVGIPADATSAEPVDTTAKPAADWLKRSNSPPSDAPATSSSLLNTTVEPSSLTPSNDAVLPAPAPCDTSATVPSTDR
jgi:hypothetical protein